METPIVYRQPSLLSEFFDAHLAQEIADVGAREDVENAPHAPVLEPRLRLFHFLSRFLFSLVSDDGSRLVAALDEGDAAKCGVSPLERFGLDRLLALQVHEEPRNDKKDTRST